MSIARITIPGADFSGFGLSTVTSTQFDLSTLASLQANWSAKNTSLMTLAGGNVTDWEDSVSGQIVTDGGVNGKAPAYSADGWAVTVNGTDYTMPCLSFDGALAGNALKSADGPFGATQACFVVVERGSPLNNGINGPRPIISSARASGSYWQNFGVHSLDGNENELAIGGSGVGARNVAGEFNVGEKSIVYVLFQPNTFYAGVNGETPVASDASGASETPGLTSFSIGGQWHSAPVGTDGYVESRTINCKIAEVLILNEAPDEATRQRIEGHLAWEWGIAANLDDTHPYKSVPPTGN